MRYFWQTRVVAIIESGVVKEEEEGLRPNHHQSGSYSNQPLPHARTLVYDVESPVAYPLDHRRHATLCWLPYISFLSSSTWLQLGTTVVECHQDAPVSHRHHSAELVGASSLRLPWRHRHLLAFCSVKSLLQDGRRQQNSHHRISYGSRLRLSEAHPRWILPLRQNWFLQVTSPLLKISTPQIAACYTRKVFGPVFWKNFTTLVICAKLQLRKS